MCVLCALLVDNQKCELEFMTPNLNKIVKSLTNSWIFWIVIVCKNKLNNYYMMNITWAVHSFPLGSHLIIVFSQLYCHSLISQQTSYCKTDRKVRILTVLPVFHLLADETINDVTVNVVYFLSTTGESGALFKLKHLRTPNSIAWQ